MDDEVLDKLLRSYLTLRLPVSSFAWQGGEPTLMGLDFYKKVVRLQQKYGTDGQIVGNALQTNGILLDEKWCRFLSEFKWLVGISLDGPKQYHDYYRVYKAGGGTFDKVMSAIENCRKYKVEFNILVLLNDRNVLAPDELFDFVLEHKIEYLQFIPCVERDSITNEISSFSITANQYGDFLCRIFDRWYKYGPGKLSVRIFDSLLNFIIHGKHTNCTFGRKCDDYIVVEHNGDVFCCDFFVDERHRLGSILEVSVEELARGQRKQQFARDKSNLSGKCFVCRHNAVCRGGCLKDRLVMGDDCASPSYFCDSYKEFFDYAMPRLALVASKIADGSYRNL